MLIDFVRGRCKILIIEEKDDGIYLYSCSDTGHFSGDMWHRSIQEAKDQADYQYPQNLGEWKRIPKGIDNSLEYVIKQIKK